jgi:CheY-like chemotaxis protein
MAIDGYILVAEDEDTDAFLLKRALRKAAVPCEVVIVRDGQEAVDYVSREGNYANRAAGPSPTLIILDLKMPRMNGFDVLAWLAVRPAFKNIPAVVLSSSSDEADIRRAQRLGAREYFVKPYAFADLEKIAGQIQARWLGPVPRQSAAVAPVISAPSELKVSHHLQH